MNTGNVLQRIWTLSLVILLAGFIGIGQTNAQSTYYVDAATGNDTFNGAQMSVGLFPAGPFATITAALAASAGSDGNTIVVLAGDYNANGVLASVRNTTIQVRTSGGNVNVLVDGFSSATAGKTLTLGVETANSGGTFVTNGGANDVALTTGGINVTGAVTIGAGGTITRTAGTITGNALTTSNYNVTYTGALAANATAGNELNASLGTGTLTFSHTAALVTVPNAVTAGLIASTSTGNVTFSSNAVSTGAVATALNITGGATVTVTGTLNTSNAAGGVTLTGASRLTAGATTVNAGGFNHGSTGAVTVASLSLPVNASALTVTSTGAFTSTGDITVGGTAGRTIISNTSTAVVTAGSVTTGAPFVDVAGDQVDITSTISNASTGTVRVNGALTEGSVADAGGVVNNELEFHALTLANAANGIISIGASSTVRGDINNAEADGKGAGAGDGQGIVLANSSTLTFAPATVANATQFGDFVGGTLVLSYGNAAADAAAGGTILTYANNVVFSNVAMANPAAGNLGTATGTSKFGGDVTISRAAMTWATTFDISGTLNLTANTTAINPPANSSFGGLNITSTGNSFAGAGTVTVTGTTATLSNTTFANAFTASTADATITAPGGFTTSLNAQSIAFSGAAASTVGTTINVTNLTIASGTTVNWTTPGAGTSDISGSATVNGTFNVGASTGIGIGSMTIDATTGSVATAGATTWNFDGTSFTGGTYTDTGSNDTINFAVPSNGVTVAVKPGTVWGALGFTGSGRTATLTQSVTVAGNVTLGNDVNVSLGENSIVMTGVGAVLDLQDEASIANTGTNGSVQFNANAQRITVSGAPNVTPSLTNVVVNNVGGANALWIDESINIAGTLALLDGGVLVDGDLAVAGPYTGAAGPNATAATLTFTGGSAAIARTFPNEGITLGAAPNDVMAGNYDLTGSGTLGTFGSEWSASQMRNVTISATGVVNAPATVATISGNVNISNATGSLATPSNTTVTGNVTVTGLLTPAANFTFSGALTTANNATGGIVNGAGTLIFAGNNQTHTHAGDIQAASSFTGTGIVVNGSIAAGDANGDSEFGNITSAANSSATLNSIQDINGTVTVSGTLTANLVSDGAAVADTDGQVTGLVDVNNGGSFTLSSNDTATTMTGGATVNDGGTFTAGSNLGTGAAMIVGDGTQATAATFDLNGKTFTTGAFTFTVNASTGAVAPGFGSTGTLSVAAGGSIVGATNPTIPNVTLNGGAGTEIDSDITVTGTFTVAAASNGADGDDVTLSGASAIGAFNADYTAATIGTAGSQIKTTGTSITSNLNAVAISNLWVASTSTTSMSRSNAGTTTFTVSFLNHDSGVLDITDEILVIDGDSNGATDDWDHDGGSYAGTGTFTITGAGASPIDLDTNGIISIPNLTINGAAAQGLQINSVGDGVSVTGTLTLNGGAGNVETEVGATDASFAVADDATIVRSSTGVTNHFDNAPTLGTGLTVRYTGAGATTTSVELPLTLKRLEWEGGNFTLSFPDARALTMDELESAGLIEIDGNNDGDNSITITAGGTIEYDGDNADFGTGTGGAIESPTAAGALTLFFNNASFTTTDRTWRNEYTGSTLTVTVHGSDAGGAADAMVLHESKSAGTVTVGDGTTSGTNGTVSLATGGTLSAGTLNVNSDGTITGTVNVSGNIASSGTTTGVNITVQGNASLTGGAPGPMTFNGTTAQTLTAPTAGFTLASNLTVNNSAGVTLAGGSITANGGLTLTAGVVSTGTNTLTIAHTGPGGQGFTQTNGCVFGNVRKTINGTGTANAPADRLQFPLCTSAGTMRTGAITFNTPGQILAGAGTAFVTMRADQGGEAGAAELSGTNGLPVVVNGVNVARYPTGPSFYWTVTPNFTMSPSLQYDMELRGGDYPNFSSSCDTAACDINEIFAIRRHVGSSSNQWAVASSTIDNFLSGSDDPVVIARSGTGALQTSGTVFTYGLKSIFGAAAGAQTFATSTGFGHVVDLSTLFTGFSGSLTYSAVSSNNTAATNPTTANVTGNNLTVVGGASAGAATVTVTARDSFGGTATATFTVNNSAALTAAAADLSRTLNVGGTSSVLFADAFTGGAGTVTYAVASSNAAVTAVGNATGVTLTAVSAGSATITITATDASSTPNVVTKTFTVTSNTGVSVAAAVADMSVVQGATATVNTAGVFGNGTGAITVAVSGGNTTASATIAAGVVTITGLKAYAGSPLADTAPVTITLTGTDTLGGTSTDVFTVNVTPVKGDLDGSGKPSAASASIALDASLGLVTLTAKQATAVDYNGDTVVTAYDAALIFAAAGSAKDDILANINSRVEFGSLEYVNGTINVPVQLVGDLNEVVSAQISTFINPAMATIVGITSNLQDGWMVKHVIGEDGSVRLAVAGTGDMTADGTIATIAIKLNDANAMFNLAGEGAVNNNSIAAIDAIEVAELPETFTLQGNYPNPFNPSTTIQFDLPETADVEIQVFDMVGRVVMTLPSQNIKAGSKRSVQVNASQLASGSYFYRVIARMESKTLVETGRMMLVK